MTYKTKQKITHRLLVTLAWVIAIIFFFPIFWMILTSFKTELQAIAVPPLFIFDLTFENYSLVNERSDYFHHAMNSIITSFGATLLSLIIAVPAAYSFAFSPTKNTKDVLLWMLSTKMLPAVGGIGSYIFNGTKIWIVRYKNSVNYYICTYEFTNYYLDVIFILQRFTKRYLRSL